MFPDDVSRNCASKLLSRCLVSDLASLVISFTGVFIRYDKLEEEFPNDGVLFLKGRNHPLHFRRKILKTSHLDFITEYNASKVLLISDTFSYRPHSNITEPLAETQIYHGRKWSLQAVKDCIFLAEKKQRPKTNWFGDIDSSHVFFEGLYHNSDGSYSACWGS